MGVDVAALLATHDKQNQGKTGRSVVFTFCGPKGLIEGGSNQKISLVVDTDNIQKVSDLKNLLQRELDIEEGIDIILRDKVGGKRIKTGLKLKQACLKGAITVEFIEVTKPERDQYITDPVLDGDDDQYSDQEFQQDEPQ